MDAAQADPAPETLERLAHARLREDILGGALPPGSRLRIRELCARYGIGATPIREALSRLVPEELVLVEANKGFSVAPLSVQEVAEVTELREVLECHGLLRAIERGDDAWEGRVVAAHHRLRRAVTAPLPDPAAQRRRWEEAHHGFHAALISACGNDHLLAAVARLYQTLLRYRALLQMNDLPADRLLAIHDELAEAALARDAAAAAARMRSHVKVNMAQVEENVRLRPDLLGEAR